MVRVGVVGIGGYGGRLIELLDSAAAELDIRIAACADSRLAGLSPGDGPPSDLAGTVAELAGRGVALFDDATEMFRRCRGQCDAMYVATSIHSHAALAVAAARAGYHVHLEKPPAATVQEVDEILAALTRSRRMCQVGFQGVHSPGMRLLQERIAAGRLGRVSAIVCRAGWPRNRAYYRRNAWAGTLRQDDAWVLDGPATNALAHQLMHMLLLAGREVGRYAQPTSVRAELYAAGPIESHDTAAIEIETADGPRIYWLGSHCTEANFGPLIEVRGEGGRAVWHVSKEVALTYADGSRETAPCGDGRLEMVRNFIEAVRTGEAAGLRCTPADARTFVAAADAAHESSGRIHRVDAAFCRRAEAGSDNERTIVGGLDDAIRAAADRACLLSDLSPAPEWAVAGEPFSVADYSFFPQRFTAD